MKYEKRSVCVIVRLLACSDQNKYAPLELNTEILLKEEVDVEIMPKMPFIKPNDQITVCTNQKF